jgi:hypothetical protein
LLRLLEGLAACLLAVNQVLTDSSQGCFPVERSAMRVHSHEIGS